MEAHQEVVRLSLGNGQPTLNVLAAGVEGDRLSVVCPFPVLPMELPVLVTLPGAAGGAATAGRIRSVKLDLSDELGLPRFKLQLELYRGEGVEEARAVADGVSIEVDEYGAEPPLGDEEEDAADEEAAAAPVDEEAAAAPVDEEAAAAPVDEEAAAAPVDEEAAAPIEADDEVEADPTPWEEELEALGDPGAEGIDEYNWPLSDELREAVEAEVAAWDPGPKEAGDAGPELELDDDPPWAATGFEGPSLPEPEPERERRLRWPMRTAVALALLVSVAAVAYVMRQQVTALVTPWLGDSISLASLGLDPGALAGTSTEPSEPRAAEPAPAPAAEPAAEPAAAEAAEPPPAEAALPAVEPAGATDEGDLGLEDEVEGPAAEAPAPESGAVAAAEEPAPAASTDSIRVTLPTQWAVSEARSYRLHDPTGIVVDIPGGMAAQSARWIDTSDGRIRSVRVIEREEGVRFIIYLTDPAVPRYRIGYGRTGVVVDILGPDPRHVAS